VTKNKGCFQKSVKVLFSPATDLQRTKDRRTQDRKKGNIISSTLLTSIQNLTELEGSEHERLLGHKTRLKPH